MKCTIFVQSELLPDVVAIEVNPSTRPADVRAHLLQLVPESERPQVAVYVEDEDDEHAFDGLTELPDGLRVQLHRQKGVNVAVYYAGRQVQRTFRPSSTVNRIKKWAAHELGITPSDAAELALQISGTDVRPDADTHIGTLVVAPAKGISFDLVPSPRVNG